MNKSAILLASTAMLLAACNNSPANGQDGDDDGIFAADLGGDSFVKFHPQENFCVTYEHSGMMSGTAVNCMRKWGTERVEIEDFTIGIAGFTQQEKAHKIYIGDEIYVINTDNMTGTQTTNPIQEDLSNTDPIALGEAMMAGWGMVDSGEDKTIAGLQCNVMTSPTMGSVCLTENLVMLEQNFMSVNRIATSVDLTSGGDDDNYTLYERVELTEGPDVGAILNAL